MKKVLSVIILVLVVFSVSAQKKKKAPKEIPFIKSPNGLLHRYDVKNNGPKPSIGQVITIHLIGKTMTDSVIFSSYEQGKPFHIPLAESAHKGGSLEEAFSLMAKGDSMTFYVSADSLYQHTFKSGRPEFLPAGSQVKFHVKMIEFMDRDAMEKKLKDDAQAEVMKERNTLMEFARSKNLDARFTASGLCFAVEKASSGKQPKLGDTVSVHYTGRFLNGESFDSSVERNEPLQFVLGASMVIPGWDEGVALMREGEKFRLLVPAALAYGEQGRPGIPPNSILIFEVELVKVH